MNYSQATADLIQRMCDYVERKDFKLDKKLAEERLLQTYDLFSLPRPKNVVWCISPFSDKFARSAWSAGSAGSARSARSAWSARSARSAGSARSAWSAGSAGSARSAWSAGSARSAGWTALDEEFGWFVIEYEYCQNPDRNSPPNNNDQLYLKYSDLLLQALEAGAGYRVEWEDTLYIVPTPIVNIDEQNRFHSVNGPAIRWKKGGEFYFLRGESFDELLWKKISDQTITAQEVMQINDIDKRTIAMSLLKPGEMIKGLNAKLIHIGIKGNRLYECKNFMNTRDTEYCLMMTDASTPREFIKFVPPEVGRQKDADFATACGYQDAEGHSLPLEDYLLIEDEG